MKQMCLPIIWLPFIKGRKTKIFRIFSTDPLVLNVVITKGKQKIITKWTKYPDEKESYVNLSVKMSQDEM